MSKPKHLKVVDKDHQPEPVDDNLASKQALAQIAERVTPGEWDTPDAAAMFESMGRLERTTSLSLNQMEEHLQMPGVADAFLEWEAGEAL